MNPYLHQSSLIIFYFRHPFRQSLLLLIFIFSSLEFHQSLISYIPPINNFHQSRLSLISTFINVYFQESLLPSISTFIYPFHQPLSLIVLFIHLHYNQFSLSSVSNFNNLNFQEVSFFFSAVLIKAIFAFINLCFLLSISSITALINLHSHQSRLISSIFTFTNL